ncbi:MAG TPA: ROK family glucokinase [Marmoricola sp.]|nr:ROK family glucokinase [Marmoricola sp.]
MVLAVGVDVGGTKIAAGVVDEDGVILEQARMPSPSDDPTELRETIAETVADLRTRHEVAAVGLGAAGFVAADRRSMIFAPHLQWGDASLADQLEEAIGLPVNVENDGNSAAWAEHRFGAGRGVDDQLTVALGTGVGGGLILDSELYRGGHGIAAEIGHLGLVRDGLPCKCGRRGCLEQYASGSALQRQARIAAAEGRAPALLEAAGGNPNQVTGRMVSEMATAGEEGAVALFEELAEALGAGLATLVAVLDPSLIVLGGGVSDAGDVLLRPTDRALRRELTGGDVHPAPELRIAELGNTAGLIGAADLARRHAARHA